MAKEDKATNTGADGHFGFDDTVEVPESSFTLLPKGEAFFTVTGVEKDRREFGKFGMCYIATISFRCSSVEGNASADVEVNFPLVKEMGWKILQLATAVGFRKNGDGPQINPAWWGKFKGEVGRCMIDHRTGKPKKEGDTPKIFNDLKEFLPPQAEGLDLK